MIKKILLLLILIFAVSITGFAQEDDLTFKIAVMGPGNELYFWWGHIALMIEDSYEGYSRFYDYGVFSFNNEDFFKNFAYGRMLYRCGVSNSQVNFKSYMKYDRDITLYTLDLPLEAKIKVRDFVANNVLPENRNYYYHHFRDNCSTRIRDIIDLATDGQFKIQFGDEKSRFTLRQHVRRHTYFAPVEDWMLNFWMGQVIDRPITVWEDMFLPSEVAMRIKDFWYTDVNGERRKLVTSVESVYKAKARPPALEKPRKQWIRELLFSLALSSIFGFFFYLQYKKKKAGRLLAGISMSLSGLVFGVSGTLLYFLSLFTNHDYTYENANMIFCTPLLLVAVPAGICYALTKKAGRERANGELLRLIWFLCVAGIIISMLIKILPAFYQDNLTDQMLMLPIALVFTLQPNGLKETLAKFKRKA
ncbi:MAG: DUF4105 domain-containing protein [Treponema sp.]|nr:DUF4105 domain-containing protein [Treponema sp.]